MHTRPLLMSLALGLLMPACLEPNPAEQLPDSTDTNGTNDTSAPADTNTPDDTNNTTDTADTNDTSDTTDTSDTVGPVPHTPVDPNAPVQPLGWCPPAPTVATPNLVMPTIPPEALEPVCGLIEQGFAPASAHQSPSNTVYVHREDGLWVVLPSSSFNNLMHAVLGGPDGKRIMEARYGMRHGLGGFAFSRWEPVYHHVYDADGHLLEAATIDGDVRQVYVSQRFEDSRLVERVEHRNNYIGDRLVLEALTTTYTWQAGLLTAARSEGWGHVWTVSYTYDAAGRPTGTERRRDDTLVERQTWSYSAQNHLERRTVMIDQRFLQEDGFDPGSLDSLGHTQAYYWDTNPWPRSVPKVAASGTCLMLPNTPNHGYPAEEGEYDLLAPAAERPQGLGWAYGNSGYGWNYGDLAWYGHGGVASLQAPVPQTSALRVESVLTYVRSRMVTEVIKTLPPLNETEVAARLVRERTLERDVEGPLMADRVDADITVASSTGEPTHYEHGRDMLFTRNSLGHLIARDLIDDDFGALERQTWTRDTAGRWLSHEVSKPNWGMSLWQEWSYQPCDGCTAQPITMWRRYERELDSAGRTVVTRDHYLDQPNNPVSSEVRYVYDAQGRLIRQSQGTYEQVWNFDTQGRLIREGWDYESDGELEGWTDIEYDDEGRWVTRATWSKDSNTPSLTWRSFATCE